MASLLALDRRIKAAKNVSRTTKAMQMIAASKLKRAQSAVVASRPYVEKLSELVGNLATKTDEKNMHPYMESHSVSNKTLLLAISPDKGLCGSLITDLIKEYLQYKHMHADTQYITVGKKITNRSNLQTSASASPSPSPEPYYRDWETRYWFTIGQSVVFSLGGWSPHVQTKFLVLRPTRFHFKDPFAYGAITQDRKSTRLNSSHSRASRMPSSA